MKRLTKTFLFLLAIAVSVNAMGIYELKSSDMYAKIQRVEDINLPSIGYQKPRGTPEEQQSFLKMLRAAGLERLSGEEQVLATLRWTMNSVTKVENTYEGRPYQLLIYCTEKNGGVLCGGMADIFHEALILLGQKARIVQLVFSLSSMRYNHVIVEVYLDGQWRIYDPSFHASYRRKGETILLGAQEMKEILIREGETVIEPVFYGEVAYPDRLETYHSRYLPHFTNVFVVSYPGRIPFWKRLPPLRYFKVDKYVYQSDTPGRWFMKLQQKMYFIHALVLPLVIMIVGALLVVLQLIERFRIKKNNSMNRTNP